MPVRRRGLRALGGALEGAANGVQDILGLMMRQSLAQQNAAYQDALLRGRTADENVTSGKWSPDDATNFRRGMPVEPSIEDRMGDLFKDISQAPTQQTVPTQEAVIGQMKAKRIPVTSFGVAPQTQPDAMKEDDNLPSTPLGPVSSQPFNQLMSAVNSKLQAFPDEQIGTDYQGSGPDLQPVNIRGRYNRDIGQTEETTRVAAGPTAGEKGTAEGTTAAMSEDLQRPGKVQTAVDQAKALQPVQVQTAASEALARQRADTQAAIERAAQTGGLLPEQVQPAMQLADDFRNESKEFFTINDSMRRMVSVANQDTIPGDIGVIFSYMKMLDPTSSVREGEQASAQNAASVPDRIRAKYNELVAGTGRLAPEQKQEFIRSGASMYSAAKIDQDKRVQDYTVRASRFKIPADLVVRTPSPGLDKIGTVYSINGRQMRVRDVDAQGNAILEPVIGGK